MAKATKNYDTGHPALGSGLAGGVFHAESTSGQPVLDNSIRQGIWTAKIGVKTLFIT